MWLLENNFFVAVELTKAFYKANCGKDFLNFIRHKNVLPSGEFTTDTPLVGIFDLEKGGIYRY